MTVFSNLLVKRKFSSTCRFLLKENTISAKKTNTFNSYFSVRPCSTGRENQAVTELKPFVCFDDYITGRRLQAERSIIVQVQSQQSCDELYNYCNRISPVSQLSFFTVGNHNFSLVEFKDDCLYEIYKKCSHIDKGQVSPLPVRSQFVWFKASAKSQKLSSDQSIPVTFEQKPLSNQKIIDWLKSAESPDDQMRVLYESTKLDDLGVRLRFLTARQLEVALSGLFPNCRLLPFGSSVNSFGKAGCDLDLVLQHDSSPKELEARLIYQVKGSGSSNSTSRINLQRQMEVLADLLQIYLPGCYSVKRILQARVPIVKYSHEITGVDCDLSLSNLSGFYMSELLYLFGEMDWRVRPLAFTVKKWANCVNLTNPTPGRWITNFSLTLLVIFYLQSKKIIPTVDDLIRRARAQDQRFAEDINCTFLRDISYLKLGANKTSLSELLLSFFHFYSGMDLKAVGVSVCTGHPIHKPDFSGLYIVNPLERSLNVSKNVSPEEVERLTIELRNAAWELETSGGNILNLLKPSTLSSKARDLFVSAIERNNRMLTVKDLFAEEPNR